MKSLILKSLATAGLITVSCSALAVAPTDTSLCKKSFTPNDEMCFQLNYFSHSSPVTGVYYLIIPAIDGKLQKPWCQQMDRGFPTKTNPSVTMRISKDELRSIAMIWHAGQHTVQLYAKDAANKPVPLFVPLSAEDRSQVTLTIARDPATQKYSADPNPTIQGLALNWPVDAQSCVPSAEQKVTNAIISNVVFGQ